MTIGGRHYMPRLQIHWLNNMSSRHAISGTSPPRAMSQIVLKLWCIAGGQPRPLSVQDRLWLLREMAQATLYYSGSKLAPTPRTRAMHWEVSRLYPTPKSADPLDTCFFCDGTPAIACQECKVLHFTFHTTVLCQSEICVGLRQFWAANGAAAVVAFAAITAANATHATPANANATDDTRPGVWICRKWYALPPQYRANFEFLAKYLIHSLDSGDFSVSAKKKLMQKNQIIMAFGSTFLKKCTQI